MEWPRKIIHVDMDAFFASIEQRDHPEYRGQPVIVGGNPQGRGVVSTCSYEARKFGVHSAMPAAAARRLCPQAVFLRPNFPRYLEVSGQIMAILRQHTDLVEPLSVDEAYLDVTRHRFGIRDPVMIARLLKQNIFAVTHLTASAGVAPNPFLAKIASDQNKPDGLTVVPPDEIETFLKDLAVRKIPGVGPVTEKILIGMGIQTVGELAAVSLPRLVARLGKTGVYLHERSHGIDPSEVVPDAEAKQSSAEETFEKDILDKDWLKARLKTYARQVFEDLKAGGRMGRTVVLKIKYHDFRQITRSKTLARPPRSWGEVYAVACELLDKKTEAGKKPVRLVGLGLSGLKNLSELAVVRQNDLFPEINPREEAL